MHDKATMQAGHVRSGSPMPLDYDFPTAHRKHIESISTAYRQHIDSILVLPQSRANLCGEGDGQQRWPPRVFNTKINSKYSFFGRTLPPGETQNIVENTICYRYAVDVLSICCRYAVGVFSPCGVNSQNKCGPELVKRNREANSSKTSASETQPVLGTSVFKS